MGVGGHRFKRTKYWKTLEERNWLDEMMEKCAPRTARAVWTPRAVAGNGGVGLKGGRGACRYDTSDTGNLLFKEVGKMLKDMSGGEEPTDEEVAFVIRSTHRDPKDRNDDLTRSEVTPPAAPWHPPLGTRPRQARGC